MNVLGELSSTFDKNKARISRIKEILNNSSIDVEELKEQQSTLEKEDARFIQLHLEHSWSKYHMYFGEYNTDMFLRLCPYMKYQEFSWGEKVFTKDDNSKWFYFIIDGTVHVLETSSTGEEKISSIHNSNDIFGLKKKSDEGGLTIRNRDAVAQWNTTIIQIDTDEYEKIRSQRILSAAEEKIEFLWLNIPGLRKVDRSIVHELETLFQKEKWTKGYRIIQQEKPNDFLYFWYSGELRIYVGLSSFNYCH